jgi:hypothetical protein
VQLVNATHGIDRYPTIYSVVMPEYAEAVRPNPSPFA